MARTEELSDFQCGTVLGCYLSNKFLPCECCPGSTVSAVIVKWKRLGATAAQPQSGRPRKLTKTGPPNAEACSISTVATLTTEFQTAPGSNICTRTVRGELHEMGFHGRAAAHKPKSPCTMPTIGWSGVKLRLLAM